MARDATSPTAVNQSSLVSHVRDNAVVSRLDEPFQTTWYRDTIEPTRWNKQYPFQLIVVENKGEGVYVPKKGKGWKYTLPVPPESLNLQNPFAIQSWITLGGSVEEHNGSPIRLIDVRGTFGVLPARPASSPVGELSFAESIFAGTLLAAQNLQTAVRRLSGGQSSFERNTIPDSSFNDTDSPDNLGKLTGYYQWRLLQYFFETYSDLKKTRDGRDCWLAFAIWKDQAVYLVQPMDFSVNKSAQSPLKYSYSLQLKSTSRISLSTTAPNAILPFTPLTRDPNKLSAFLTNIENARRVLQNAKKVVAALGPDVNRVLFEPLREMALMAKDASDVALAVADLPDSVIGELKGAMTQSKAYLDRVRKNLTVGPKGRQSQTVVSSLTQERSDNVRSHPSQNAHPANSVFADPKGNFDFFSAVRLGDIRPAPATVAKIARERERVRNLTRLDYQDRRNAIVAASTQMANALGLGSATYNEIYGQDNSNSSNTATDEDFELLFSLNQLAIEMDRLIATDVDRPTTKVSALASVAGLASRSGIAFTVPRSKYAVPFPYGSTLEMLAARYLGDPNRWFEIAALNGLQSPYVDEVGFKLPLLTSGSGNQVLVADSSQLFVGQPVWVSSVASSRTNRHIVKLDKLSPTQTLVSVSGEADMDRFSILATPILEAFLPNTVNAQQTIFIPSDVEPKESDFRTKAIPGLDDTDALLSIGGIDFLLTPKNDLVLDPNGNVKWSVGLTNIIQKIRLALSTRQGSVLEHPEYGFPLEAGMSLADLEPGEVAKAAEEMFGNDPSFSGITAVQTQINGPSAQVNIAVELAATQQVVPLSFELKL